MIQINIGNIKSQLESLTYLTAKAETTQCLLKCTWGYHPVFPGWSTLGHTKLAALKHGDVNFFPRTDTLIKPMPILSLSINLFAEGRLCVKRELLARAKS